MNFRNPQKFTGQGSERILKVPNAVYFLEHSQDLYSWKMQKKDMTSYLARMMTQKFQIETRGTWGCPWSPAKRILEISFTDKALGFSQDWHFLNLWSAPLSSRIYFFPKFSWIYRFSDMLNLFMKRNYYKNQFFAILSFCEIYVFFPQSEF